MPAVNDGEGVENLRNRRREIGVRGGRWTDLLETGDRKNRQNRTE